MFIKSYKSDLTESITSITATMKLDLSTYFKMMQKMVKLNSSMLLHQKMPQILTF